MKMREPLNRLTGTWRNHHFIYKMLSSLTQSTESGYLRVDLHGEKESEVGMGGERVKLLLKLNQPLRSQVDILQ